MCAGSERALPLGSGDLGSGLVLLFQGWRLPKLSPTYSGLLSLTCKVRDWATSPLISLAAPTCQDFASKSSSNSEPLSFKSYYFYDMLEKIENKTKQIKMLKLPII